MRIAKSTPLVALFVAAVWIGAPLTACAAGVKTRVVKVKAKDEKGKEKKKKKKKKIKILKTGKRGPFTWYGKKKRGYLGVHLMSLNKELRAHFGAPEDAGIMISSVEKDSPAEKAGVQVGDVLVEVDGQEVGRNWEAVKLIGKKKDGEKATLKVIRNRSARTLTASIVEKERSQVEVSKFFHGGPFGDDEEIEIMVDTEPFEHAMEHAHEYLEKMHELDEKGKHLYEYRFKLDEEGRQLEERMKELEEKIKQLEKKLQGKARNLKKSGRST
jgi:hypothetical protein